MVLYYVTWRQRDSEWCVVGCFSIRSVKPTLRFMMSQRCSIGDKSADHAGHGKTNVVLLYKISIDSCIVWPGIVKLKVPHSGRSGH